MKKLKHIRDTTYRLFSNSVGIDLGTANTILYLKNYGIVINEPSVVAVNQKTGQVVAVGAEAKQMLGRTPQHIAAVRPLVDGVISNFEVAEEMIAHFLRKIHGLSQKLVRPTVVIGVPSGITNVETRAVRDVTKNAGAREVFVVEEPMAAAIGIGLPVRDPVGTMVVDIGGGTTDIAVISLSGVVRSKNLRIAGDRFDEDIISYVRNEFKILIGERTAESVKIAIGSVVEARSSIEVPVRGRDLVTGLPREVIITDADIREAISSSVFALIDSIKEVLESTPPEVLSDVMARGIILVGGGSMISGLQDLLSETLRIPIHIADDPMTAVVRGTGVIAENVSGHAEMLIDSDDGLPPIL